MMKSIQSIAVPAGWDTANDPPPSGVSSFSKPNRETSNFLGRGVEEWLMTKSNEDAGRVDRTSIARGGNVQMTPSELRGRGLYILLTSACAHDRCPCCSSLTCMLRRVYHDCIGIFSANRLRCFVECEVQNTGVPLQRGYQVARHDRRSAMPSASEQIALWWLVSIRMDQSLLPCLCKLAHTRVTPESGIIEHRAEGSSRSNEAIASVARWQRCAG